MKEIDFKDLFYNVPVPLIMTDERGIIRLVNKQAELFLETDHERLAGSDFMKLLHQSYERSALSFSDFHESLHTQFDYLIRSKSASGIYTQIKYHVQKSGEEDLYIFSFQPLKTNDQISYDLKEQVKEQLSIINVIDTFFNHPDLGDALTCCLPAICDGCRFPGSAVARIHLSDGEIFATENFRETEWMMRVSIESTKGVLGVLELGYLVGVPLYDGLTFMFEEERLLKVLSRIIGMLIQKWKFVNDIRDNERMIQKITSQVPGNTYVFELDDSGNTNIIFINRGTDEFNHSFDLDDVARHAEKIREALHEDDRTFFNEKMKEAHHSNKFISFQYRMIVNDKTRWRWMQAVPEKDKNGKVVWYGATRDITPLVDYIVSIEQTLFDLSHVIRRPIATMLGLTTLVRDNDFDKEEMKDISDKLHLCVEEMDKFIIELNNAYNEKKEINSLNVDFSSLIDKRQSLFS